MSLPRISIVTPSFNQGQYLEQTIRSVLDQGYPNLEYIICDGGSTDNSVEIIKKYVKQLAYWCSEKDRGQSHAINKTVSEFGRFEIEDKRLRSDYFPYLKFSERRRVWSEIRRERARANRHAGWAALKKHDVSAARKLALSTVSNALTSSDSWRL